MFGTVDYVNVLDYGASVYSENNVPAFARALKAVREGGTVFIPNADGEFAIKGDWVIDRAVKIEGHGFIHSASKLRFRGGGIVITHPHVTIKNLNLKGDRFAADIHHGIDIQARAVVEGCYIESFSGSGIHANTYDDPEKVNANNCEIRSNVCQLNYRHGIHLEGDDANATVLIGNDVRDNYRWGILDRSFLGNTYIGNHLNNNGRLNKVSYQGGRYICLWDECTGVAPMGHEHSDLMWHLEREGGPSNTWPEWSASDTYHGGGGFCFARPREMGWGSSNSNNQWFGGYFEKNNYVAITTTGDMIYPGTTAGVAFLGTGTVFRSKGGTMNISGGLSRQFDGGSAVEFGGNGHLRTALTIYSDREHQHGLMLREDDNGTVGWFRRYYNPLLLMGLRESAYTGGRNHPLQDLSLIFPQGSYIGGGKAVYVATAAAPPEGDTEYVKYEPGDRLHNDFTKTQDCMGWVLTASGWVSWGMIQTEPDKPTA